MIRIRKITNPYHEANIRKIRAVKEILREQFQAISEDKIAEFETQFVNPLSKKYQTAVFVAEDIHETVRAGYYCFDTFTPLNQEAYLAARWGVNCVLSAADAMLAGTRYAYVLTRPPGHHTERSVFGGFCYFNNCAIAAHYLSRSSRVAILDIDYHHGNGQQQIFYSRSDVLTISIHGHPSFAYPYFSGFEEEKGEGDGIGFNHNFPLPEKATHEQYVKALSRALNIIKKYNPDYLIVALGLDPAKGDPTGTWSFTHSNFTTNGEMIGSLKLPTLVVQEGGYRNQSLGINARAFFTGFHRAHNSKNPTT